MMVRASSGLHQRPLNGMETASRELHSLLDRSLDEECGSASDILTTGYHVALFLRCASQQGGGDCGQPEGGSAGADGSLSGHGGRAECRAAQQAGEKGGKASAQLSKPFRGGRNCFLRAQVRGGDMRWVRSILTHGTSWHSSRYFTARRWFPWRSFPIVRIGRCRFFSAGHAYRALDGRGHLGTGRLPVWGNRGSWTVMPSKRPSGCSWSRRAIGIGSMGR